MQKLLVASIGMFLLFNGVAAQPAGNADSLSLVSKLEADQQKLNDLQAQLEQRLKSKEDAMAKAQRSANENAAAAGKLSSDPKHKKLAKRAYKKSRAAMDDAKTARIETDKVNRLNKDIRATKNRMAKNEKRLKKYTQPASIKRQAVDTTRHY